MPGDIDVSRFPSVLLHFPVLQLFRVYIGAYIYHLAAAGMTIICIIFAI